jgi:xanthine dehydrogenase accessory factor
VYDIAVSVRACLRAGTRVDVAWAVQAQGFPSWDRNEALAFTPGGGRVGSVLSGAADEQLAAAAADGATGRLVELAIGDVEALVAGLPGGGDASCLLVTASDLPGDLWDRLAGREAVCLVTRLDGGRVVETALYDDETSGDAGEDVAELFRGARSSTTLVDEARVVTVLVPVPKLFLVGGGPIAEAVAVAAIGLGWHVRSFTEAAEATAHITALSALDSIVVFGHDDSLTGAALKAALAGPVGYIGGVGPRRVEESREDWLKTRGVEDLSRIHGRAGLPIGAATPSEIAVSVLAEAIAAHRSAG